MPEDGDMGWHPRGGRGKGGKASEETCGTGDGHGAAIEHAELTQYCNIGGATWPAEEAPSPTAKTSVEL